MSINTVILIHTRKLSFAQIVATPQKLDQLAELKITIECLRAKNEELKTRVCTLKTQLDLLVQLANVKVKEVETSIKDETCKGGTK